MKKSTLLVMVIISVFLTACDANNDSSVVAKPEEEIILAETEETEEAEESEEVENVQYDYRVYERAVEWDNVENPEFAVQIDDVFYEFGVPVKEIIDKLSSSNIEYSFKENKDGYPAYTEDMIVNCTGYSVNKITVLRNSMEWFDIYYVNLEDEILSINDCLCVGITISDDALPCSWILGMNYEELTSIRYDEVDNLLTTINGLNDAEIDSNSVEWKVYDELIKECSGQKYIFEQQLDIEINKSTGTIGEYRTRFLAPIKHYDYLKSFEGVDKSAFDNLINDCISKMDAEIHSQNIVEAILYERQVNRDGHWIDVTSICFVFEVEHQDWFIEYATVDWNRVLIDEDGKIYSLEDGERVTLHENIERARHIENGSILEAFTF